MSSRFGSSVSGKESRMPAAMNRRAGTPVMSEKQINAYLMARDTLRTIRRNSLASAPGQMFDILPGSR